MIEILLALLVYGTAVEPRFILDVDRQVAELPALQGAWEGETIAVLADWQLGMWLDNPGTVRRAVERVVRERPAAVLIAGDFVTEPGRSTARKVRKVVEMTRLLTDAGIPTFAVLGNHDFGLPRPDEERDAAAAARLVDRLEEAGVQVLRNQAMPLFHPLTVAAGPSALLASSPIYVVGIGSRYADNDHALTALEGVPFHAPRVVLNAPPRLLPAAPGVERAAGHRRAPT